MKHIEHGGRLSTALKDKLNALKRQTEQEEAKVPAYLIHVAAGVAKGETGKA